MKDLKLYNVRVTMNNKLFKVPGKEIKLSKLPGRFLATRPVKENIKGELEFENKDWIITEFSTGFSILPAYRNYRVKKLIEDVEEHLTDAMIKQFPKIISQAIKKYGMANQEVINV